MALLNKYLGQYQFSERHAITIAAPSAWILAAVAAYDPKHDRFFPQHDSAARLLRAADATR